MTHAAGEAINEGAYAVGQQVAASKGMFASFKEEYEKARFGEEPRELASSEADDSREDEERGTLVDCDVDGPGIDAQDAQVDDVFDEDEEQPKAKKKPTQASKGSSVSGMFAAFKEEYNKARYDD